MTTYAVILLRTVKFVALWPFTLKPEASLLLFSHQCFCTWSRNSQMLKSFTLSVAVLLFKANNVSLKLSLFVTLTVQQVFKYSFLASYLIYNLYTRWVNRRHAVFNSTEFPVCQFATDCLCWLNPVSPFREVKELNPPEVSDSVLQFASWGAHSQQLVSFAHVWLGETQQCRISILTVIYIPVLSVNSFIIQANSF